MNNSTLDENQIRYVSNFQDLVSTSLQGKLNAVCWKRNLIGDFSEIVHKLELNKNMMEVRIQDLLKLQLSEQGQLAREIILKDFKLLKDYGALPILNLIKHYERDNTYPFFPTDVYSYHVDHSPIPTDTFLCTYYGESSEILPNSQAEQKIHIPEIHDELKKIYHGEAEDFESFLNEHFFDLHYNAKPNATPIQLGLSHIWRLAVDCPETNVLPCIHRAPKEKDGQYRLLLIC